MLRPIVSLLLLGLVSPAFGQAVEAEGTQTQSLELLDGSLSVTLDSAGSLSLGRGGPSADLGVGLSVNDLNIVSVGDPRGATPADNLAVPGAAPRHGGSTGTQGGTAEISSAGGAPQEACRATFATQGLIGALEAGRRIWLRPTACAAADPQAAQMISNYVPLASAISGAGFSPDDVTSITLSDDLVIVGMAARK